MAARSADRTLHAERFELLRNTVEGPDGSAPIGAPLFACHLTPPDVPSACAGWLAVEGAGHVGVRLAVVGDQLDPAALRPAPGWPDLYESFDEMCRANGDDLLSSPSPSAAGSPPTPFVRRRR